MSDLIALLRAEMPEAILEDHAQHGDLTVVVEPDRLLDLCGLLRDDAGFDFDMLVDLTAVDHAGRSDGPQPSRFEVVHHLYSITRNARLRLKLRVDEESCAVDSVAGIWPAADWLEREVFDLYGIHFRGHPDLRRILLYEEFEGHPLRKDYPKSRRQPLVGPSD